MRLTLILLAQFLHREILIPAEAKFPDPDPQPAKSKWPLKECENTKAYPAGCVCEQEYQICQPLQLSATVNGSITLPCTFSFHPEWERPRDIKTRWRLGNFHSDIYLFSCCRTDERATHSDFEGRVSLAREGKQYTASVHITDLRESDSRLYFCRVSVTIDEGEVKEWQTINGTNLTVTAPPPKAEDENPNPLPLGLLVGVSIGAILLAAAIISGLVKCLITRRKGHCPKGIQPRQVTSRGPEEREAKEQELHCRGATAPAWEEPVPPPLPIHPQAQQEPVPVYASLVLSEDLKKKKPLKRDARAEEETTYAAVRH